MLKMLCMDATACGKKNTYCLRERRFLRSLEYLRNPDWPYLSSFSLAFSLSFLLVVCHLLSPSRHLSLVPILYKKKHNFHTSVQFNAGLFAKFNIKYILAINKRRVKGKERKFIKESRQGCFN